MARTERDRQEISEDIISESNRMVYRYRFWELRFVSEVRKKKSE